MDVAPYAHAVDLDDQVAVPLWWALVSSPRCAGSPSWVFRAALPAMRPARIWRLRRCVRPACPISSWDRGWRSMTTEMCRIRCGALTGITRWPRTPARRLRRCGSWPPGSSRCWRARPYRRSSWPREIRGCERCRSENSTQPDAPATLMPFPALLAASPAYSPSRAIRSICHWQSRGCAGRRLHAHRPTRCAVRGGVWDCVGRA
jgi:hypothetical protein